MIVVSFNFSFLWLDIMRDFFVAVQCSGFMMSSSGSGSGSGSKVVMFWNGGI